MYLFRELNILPLLVLFLLWGIGGWLMLSRHFDLELGERGLIGFGIGLVVSNAFANFLARWISLDYAFWVSALATILLGVLLAWPLNRDLLGSFKVRWGLWVWFGLTALLFTLIGRGLAIFDDYQNLPTLSLMATGDIPPHLPLRPDVWYGYHYLLLLLATQIMRVGAAAAWTAADLARGLVFALTFFLAGLLAWRLTRRRLLAGLSAFFVAFAGGTRWLLLLLPVSLLKRVSDSVTLIGSGHNTASNLFDALALPWEIAKGGPVPFPFAFANGFNSPLSMMHNGYGTTAVLALLLLLLIGEKRRHWLAGIPVTIILASMALANEVDWFLVYAGFLVAVLAWFIVVKRVRIPRSLASWIMMAGIAGVLALVQGGMATEVVRGKLTASAAQADSYFKVGFKLVSPTIISSHLGYLSLLKPLQLLAAIFEVGPVVLVFPLVIAWGLKALHSERWLEAAVAGSAFVSALTVFVEYYGNAGPTATTRLQFQLLTVCKILAVPLVWIWLEKRKQDRARFAVAGLGGVAAFGGVVLFGIQLIAVPRPVLSYYLTDMDARFEMNYWNRLPVDAWVFDPDVYRAPVLFGRPANGISNWGVPLPEWEVLEASGDPYAIHAAGYDFMYFDKGYWKQHQALLDDPCVRLVDEVDGEKEEHGSLVPDFRKLVQIDGCTR